MLQAASSFPICTMTAVICFISVLVAFLIFGFSKVCAISVVVTSIDGWIYFDILA